MISNRTAYGLLPLLLMAMGIPVFATVPMAGDVVLGLGNSVGSRSLELVRGDVVPGGGASVPDFWDTPWMASVAFDNYGGIQHNARGNLLGVDFGGPGGTGSIYSLSTLDPTVTMGERIGDTIGLGGSNLSFTTRLTSLVVSPDNSKVAVQGYDAGTAIVYDYQPGNRRGSGASLSGARDTQPILLPTDFNGLAWLDNTTLAALSSDGTLWTIDSGTMTSQMETFIDVMPIGGDNTTLLYNPEISPMMFAGYSGFNGIASESRLFVIDPSDFSLVHQVDLSLSGESIREMAFDAAGNLFYVTFGSDIEVIEGAAHDPMAIADNSSVDWYTSPVFSSFPGMDIGLAVPEPGSGLGALLMLIMLGRFCGRSPV
ncbi:MAG: hypothetical protein AAGF97_13730 [Planctomycetota bacterium]